jgi:hypothetical protein
MVWLSLPRLLHFDVSLELSEQKAAQEKVEAQLALEKKRREEEQLRLEAAQKERLEREAAAAGSRPLCESPMV